MRKPFRLSYFSLILFLTLALFPSAAPGQPQVLPTGVNGAPVLSLAAPEALGPEHVTSDERERLIQEAMANLWRYLPDLETHRPQPMAPQAENGQIAYVGADDHLYLMNPDGTGQRAVVTDLSNIADPAWSPDSGWLAFAADGSGGRCLYRLEVATSTHSQVVCGFLSLYEPFWAPDGNRLAFWGQQVAGLFRAWAVPAAGGAPVELAPSFVQVLTPRWRDSDTVLLSGEQPANIFKLYRVDMAQPDSPTAITPEFRCSDECTCDENDVYLAYPHLSPDGTTVSFVGGRTEGDKYSCTGYYAVYLVDPLGSTTPSKIVDVADTSSGMAVVDASQWAPDNRRVGLYANGSETSSDGVVRIKVADTITGILTVLHGREGGGWDGLSWSPDATQLAAGYLPTSGNPEVDAVDWQSDAFTILAQGDDPAWERLPYVPPPTCQITHQPILFVHGWRGQAGSLSADDQLKWFLNWLDDYYGDEEAYEEGCSAFYALDVTDGNSRWVNAEHIGASLCNAARIIRQTNPTWNGHFDIVAHSYGGIWSRVYLESVLYHNDRYECDLQVDNLFTLGTPHGGAGDLPNVWWYIALTSIPDFFNWSSQEWLTALELLPPFMDEFNRTHQQPVGVCYRLLGGDVNEQLGALRKHIPTWLISEEPNDFLVKRSSAHVLATAPYSGDYPHTVLSSTPDMHGYNEYLAFVRSYVYPGYACEDHIAPYVGLSVADCTGSGVLSPSPANQPSEPFAVTLVAADVITTGQTLTGTFPLSSPVSSSIFLSWLDGDLEFILEAPDGTIFDPASAEADPNSDYVELDLGYQATRFYVFTDTLVGAWIYTTTAISVPYNMPFAIYTTMDHPLTLDADVNFWQPTGQEVVITAILDAAGTPVLAASVETLVSLPDGSDRTLTLFDDGAHDDGGVNDGVYGNRFVETAQGGHYTWLVSAQGTFGSETFLRSDGGLFQVAEPTVTLTGNNTDYGQDNDGDGRYEALIVDLGLDVQGAGDYRLSASLKGPGGAMVASTSQLVSLSAGVQTHALRFDGQSIYDSGLNGPYVVTDLFIFDETTLPLKLLEADEVHTTAAYNHRDFGWQSWDVFLPIVVK